MIDYSRKLTTHREYNEVKNLHASIESDRGRVLSSAAFRRLQNRTQVFALELNASIRTRLTHSLEVAQTARYIAKTILSKLDTRACKLDNLQEAFVSTAEMASLLHDIGNPPFGHFAEQTINKWAKENIPDIFNSIGAESSLKQKLISDLCNFDGNAQAIRIITKLQRLNLSYSQIVSVLKYTRAAYDKKSGYLQKKPGFYFSEEDIVAKIQKSLDIQSGNRFFIVYIMEAADDISYLTADLEDAVVKGILSLDDVYNLIKQECEKEGENYLLDLITNRYKLVKEKEQEPYQFNMFFTLFRASLVNDLVRYVADIYIKNHQVVFDGSFDGSLLESQEDSKYNKAIKILQRISIKHIYQNRSVQDLELKGYAIVNGLLNAYKPLLTLDIEDFTKLIKGQKRCQ